jgi:phosphocarrier protein HPr
MGLLMLAAGPGTQLKIVADGPDESAALAAIEDLFNRRFDDDIDGD